MEAETKGIIKRIRKDRKGVDLGFDAWYSSFKELPKEINIGDEVKIVFLENKKGDKVFKNIKHIEKVQNNEPIIEIIQNENKISDTSLNTILMCVKEIAVSVVINSKEYVDLNEVIEKSTDQFIKSYKKIKSNL